VRASGKAAAAEQANRLFDDGADCGQGASDTQKFATLNVEVKAGI
jgi:hypothetical protein